MTSIFIFTFRCGTSKGFIKFHKAWFPLRSINLNLSPQVLLPILCECLHLKNSSSPHQIQNTNTKMIETELKEYERRRRKLLVFLFFMLKKMAYNKAIPCHSIRQYLLHSSQLIINFFPCIFDPIFLLVSCI